MCIPPGFFLSALLSGSRNHLVGDPNASNVVITVTTPSDEHGPTAPLLGTPQREEGMYPKVEKKLSLC